jgi:hypothetical protein
MHYQSRKMILTAGYYRDKCYLLPFIAVTAGRDFDGRIAGFQIELGWLWHSVNLFVE